MSTLGRSSRRFKQLSAEQRAKRLPCCLCGQAIDYTLEWPDTGSFSVQHFKDWHTHPELREDPANLGSAHLGCNSSAGQHGKPSVGALSESW